MRNPTSEEYQKKVLARISKNCVKFKGTRSFYQFGQKTFVLPRYSKLLKNKDYFFSIPKNDFKKFDPKVLFILFICGSEERVFVLPAKHLESLLDCSTATDGSWKLNIKEKSNYFYLCKSGENKTKISISEYLNNFGLLNASKDNIYYGNDTKNLYIWAEEVTENNKYYEGATTQIWVNSYERNDKARKKCLDHHGLNCCICGFNFEKIYGAVGKGFMQVHHLKPLSEIKEKYEVDPINDLRPVCPNCHAMIHRRNPPYSIEEMLTFYKGYNS
ncbi:HNH endonuclease [Aerosakkonemataceae cyanobacterium BLCC-F154]|uniref:HNH endonuclease n=1 Tax=Floridaenema fluviatile BLCC-F154 TaxID=3153640 RepID=A0ABV4Y532_9CYAN